MWISCTRSHRRFQAMGTAQELLGLAKRLCEMGEKVRVSFKSDETPAGDLAARYPLVVFGDAVREPMDCQEIERLLSGGKSSKG